MVQVLVRQKVLALELVLVTKKALALEKQKVLVMVSVLASLMVSVLASLMVSVLVQVLEQLQQVLIRRHLMVVELKGSNMRRALE
jgi:hypothetical protein